MPDEAPNSGRASDPETDARPFPERERSLCGGMSGKSAWRSASVQPTVLPTGYRW